MPKSHEIIEPKKYQGSEPFTLAGSPMPETLMDFWRWMGSNLLDNTMRGILAEYIVASALGITDHRREPWREYDLGFQGLKIEVKSAAYLQPWFQKAHSKIVFGIAPRLAWDPETNTLRAPARRHSDVYIFCLLETKEIERLDPLDLNQWGFYIVPSRLLDKIYNKQKSLSEINLKKLGIEGCHSKDLKDEIIKYVATNK